MECRCSFRCRSFVFRLLQAPSRTGSAEAKRGPSGADVGASQCSNLEPLALHTSCPRMSLIVAYGTSRYGQRAIGHDRSVDPFGTGPFHMHRMGLQRLQVLSTYIRHISRVVLDPNPHVYTDCPHTSRLFYGLYLVQFNSTWRLVNHAVLHPTSENPPECADQESD